MEESTTESFLYQKFWFGKFRWLVWSICIGVTLLLGFIRVENDAEYTMASLVLIPVMLMAWLGGRTNGLLMAGLAASMWAISDAIAHPPFSTHWIPWVNGCTRWLTYSLAATLIAKIRLQYEREHDYATRDALTGLLNRRAFLDLSNAEISQAKRYKRSVAVLFLDLDDFKQLNDTAGHQAGDAALCTTAKAISGTLRAGDHIGRLGGDEFAVLLPQVDYDAAVAVGNKISVTVNSALQRYPPVKISMGIAWYAVPDESLAPMLKAADKLMYESKESSKGSVRAQRIPIQDTPNPRNAH